MSDEIIWYTGLDNSKAKPHQYYYKMAPCVLAGIGYRKGEKKPAVIRVRTSDGKTHHVWASAGGFTNLTYEIFTHGPGKS